jgi:hypothetical protein
VFPVRMLFFGLVIHMRRVCIMEVLLWTALLPP